MFLMVLSTKWLAAVAVVVAKVAKKTPQLLKVDPNIEPLALPPLLLLPFEKLDLLEPPLLEAAGDDVVGLPFPLLLPDLPPQFLRHLLPQDAQGVRAAHLAGR